MLSLVLAAGVFLATDEIEGYVACDTFGFTASRAYVISENGTISGSDCVPPNEFYTGGGPQRAFLVQYKNNTLNRDGFRTTLTGWSGNAVELGRIAFTARRLDEPWESSADPRFFTILNAQQGEVQIIVSGNQLVLSHVHVFGGEANTVVIGNLLPSDFVNGALVLDTRFVYNTPNGVDGLGLIEVCTKRGAGNCFYYSVALPNYDTAPEFYMGDSVPANSGTMRARYCKLPAMTSANTGYTFWCPGPVAPPSAPSSAGE